METKMLVLPALNVAFRSVYEAPTKAGDCGEMTGSPFWSGRRGAPLDVEAGLAGVVPAEVAWSSDRGNWMWDGVLSAFRALGVDVSKPVPADLLLGGAS